MAIADNIFTGGAGTGNLATTGNWTVAIAADQNLIFPADAPTTYTLTGDLSATAVNSVINLSNCNFGASSAAPVKFNVGSVFSGHANLFDDYGTGIRYMSVANTVSANIQGRGTVEFDGLANTTLRINTTGTVTVGPVPGTPCQVETIALIAGSGTVNLENVTKAAGTAVPITKIDGQVNLKTYSRLATVNQYGGTWRHYDNGVAAHQSGIVAAIYQQAGATLFYNSVGALTALEAYGKVDFSTEDLRAKVAPTGWKFFKGSVLSDPNGMVDFTNPFQTPFCALKDVTIDVGSHKKYTVADI